VAWKIEGTYFESNGDCLSGVAHPSSSTLTIARPTASCIKAFGMEFNAAGKSALSAPFHWSS
jgi:hypothetical protein